MHAVIAWFRIERHRAYLYRVAGALGTAATADGLISGRRETLYVGLIATVLGTGTAAVNTSTKGAR